MIAIGREERSRESARAEMRRLLHAIAPRAGFSATAVDTMVEGSEVAFLGRGARVAVSDRRDDLIRFQIAGVAKEQLRGRNGRMLTVRFLGPGNFLCLPLCRTIPWGYRTEFVMHEPATVALLARDTLTHALGSMPPGRAVQLASWSWRDATRLLLRKVELLSLSMRDRVELELIGLARAVGRREDGGVVIGTVVSDYELAQLVAGSRAMVTRCIGVLRAEGLVDRVGRHLFIDERLLARHEA
jgi:CRP-like cAMP-binding protein